MTSPLLINIADVPLIFRHKRITDKHVPRYLRFLNEKEAAVSLELQPSCYDLQTVIMPTLEKRKRETERNVSIYFVVGHRKLERTLSLDMEIEGKAGNTSRERTICCSLLRANGMMSPPTCKFARSPVL